MGDFAKQLKAATNMERADALAAISDVNIGSAQNKEECIQELALFAADQGDGEGDENSYRAKWRKQQEEMAVKEKMLAAKEEQLRKQHEEAEARKLKEQEEMVA